ncbi:MAG: hypothetical protein ABI367_02690 [Mucilaginibacter sp.]
MDKKLVLEWVPAAYATDKIAVAKNKGKAVSGKVAQIVKSTGLYSTKKSLKQKMCKR